MKSQTIRSAKWVSLSQVIRQALRFGTLIVLARLLDPDDFGVMAMVVVVTGFVTMVGDLGVSAALIRERDPSPGLCSSAFWINLGVSVLAMLLVLAGAGSVAGFYQEPRVEPVLSVLSLTLLMTGLMLVQRALFERDMRFKEVAVIETSATLLGAVAAIAAAVAGWGLWALVTQTLVIVFARTAGFWLRSTWYPRFVFHWQEIAKVARFSLNLTGFVIVNFIARSADNVLIGRVLGAQSLGQYNVAYQIMLLPLRNVTYVVNRVLYPAISKVQDSPARMRKAYLETVHALATLTFPIMFGIWAVAEPAVTVLLGERWSLVASLLAILAPLGAMQSVTALSGTIFKVTGRTHIQFRWALVSLVSYVTAFVIGLRWGVVGVAACYAGAQAILVAPALWLALRPIGSGPWECLLAVSRPLLAALTMAIAVIALLRGPLAELSALIQLLTAVPLGCCLYGLLILLLDGAHLRSLSQLLLPALKKDRA